MRLGTARIILGDDAVYNEAKAEIIVRWNLNLKIYFQQYGMFSYICLTCWRVCVCVLNTDKPGIQLGSPA